MQNFKKTMRLFGLGLLLALATLGVGIAGGVPISSNKKRDEPDEIKIELVETKTNETTLTEINLKQ